MNIETTAEGCKKPCDSGAGNNSSGGGVRVKLCGLTRPEDILTANRIMPDYVGFVFYRKSRRAVTGRQAAALKRFLSPAIKVVGVFVDEDPEVILDLVRRDAIDLVQLHGREDEETVKRVQELCRVPVIRAFSVRTGEDIRAAEMSSADYVLLDSGSGGTGERFDLSLAAGRAGAFRRPWFYAGGLTPENVGEALWELREAGAEPFAVDASSSLETDGRKDPEKMRAFVRAVREAR